MSTATTKYIETTNLNCAKRNYILTALDKALTGGQDLITKTQWSPLRKFGEYIQQNILFLCLTTDTNINSAKTTLLSILKNITKGELTMESLNEEHKFGAPFDLCVDGHSFPISAKITVKDESFWVRMLLHAEFGLAGMRYQSVKFCFVLVILLGRCVYAG